MASVRKSKDAKISILKKMREKKNVLFSQFSAEVTKSDKAREWQEICNFAKSISVVKPEKGWEYIRDVFWPNIRKGTMVSNK